MISRRITSVSFLGGRAASQETVLRVLVLMALVLQSALARAGGDLPAHVKRGQELFVTCAACHKADGSGVEDGSVPAIAGQYASVIEKELADFRHVRRWNMRMEQVLYERHITRRDDEADVGAYVSSLPHNVTRSIGDGTALALGTQAYFHWCEGCHGALGQGSAENLIPRVDGQHYKYLVRQILNAGNSRRPNMSHSHMQRVRGLTGDEINGIADYLARITRP